MTGPDVLPKGFGVDPAVLMHPEPAPAEDPTAIPPARANLMSRAVASRSVLAALDRGFQAQGEAGEPAARAMPSLLTLSVILGAILACATLVIDRF